MRNASLFLAIVLLVAGCTQPSGNSDQERQGSFYGGVSGGKDVVTARAVTCGVIVTDGTRLLLGHATRSPRWDIPKGIAEPGENHIAAARRELQEETGLETLEDVLSPLGVMPYLRDKDLALFAWIPLAMPDPKTLICSTHFSFNGAMLPEFDRFGLFTLPEALEKVGKSMARILGEISLEALCGASG